MKPNEAPEKIYLLSTPYRILDGWYDNELPIPKDMKQLEYTRTDAFIEKAKKWIKDNGYMYNGEYEWDVEALAEDFVNYMKGE